MNLKYYIVEIMKKLRIVKVYQVDIVIVMMLINVNINGYLFLLICIFYCKEF